MTTLAVILWPLAPGLVFAKKAETLPWSVEVQVHWGTKKNREAYRAGFERALLADLLAKTCFQRVAGGGETAPKTDLLLEVQLNDFVTEQEYDSPETMIPGQGEEHHLLAARASVNLDYWLRPRGKDDVEIVTGHIYREAVRQPQFPTDSADDRALRDLTTDASHWVVRDLCDRRGRVLDKVTKTMGPPITRPD